MTSFAPAAAVSSPDTVATLMTAAEAADADSASALFTSLYSELHRLARRQLAGTSARVTLGTTTLLHEAYLDMVPHGGAVFPSRGRFMSYAARVMRGLIIDYVRSRTALKRGGQLERAGLDDEIAHPCVDSAELVRIGDAIDELAKIDPDQAQVVDLKFFCGFSFVEIAALRRVSERTVQRHWERARLYLHHALGHDRSV